MTLADILCPDCALFLDFDGTLVEIAAHPEAVVVPLGLVGTLGRIQRWLGGAAAVISGRSIAQIDRFLDPLVLCVAGVHGAERRRSDGSMAWRAVPPLQAVEDAASELVRSYPALRLETKRGSLALHYRQAPELEPLCLEALSAAIARSPGLALLRGKMVVEAKPAGVSKGGAIEAFLEEPPFAGRLPVFIGDDVTDEAGFAVVQARGGLAVKVGEGPTAASQRLANPMAMREALERALARETR
jgi:trehalose 6-phosphate phosphatase